MKKKYPSGISIVNYQLSDKDELLRLLLLLQSSYFKKNSSANVRLINKEHKIENSYSEYVEFLNKNFKKGWRIFLARTSSGKTIGFIIGRYKTDEALILSRTGILEDWYLEAKYRKTGIGQKLYEKLEEWFRENNCHQVWSDTWEGNELSVTVHRKLGFFVSGISFGKILKK